ncbi:MAG: hypothetical protein VYC12_05815, partial [Candidatus Thermoplasmatota archaeon]|nr:hypothetical protein [Candidatus Thermoplasmatota archaeon]
MEYDDLAYAVKELLVMGIAKAVRQSRELKEEVLTHIINLKPLRNKSRVLSTLYHIGLLIIYAEVLFDSGENGLVVSHPKLMSRFLSLLFSPLNDTSYKCIHRQSQCLANDEFSILQVSYILWVSQNLEQFSGCKRFKETLSSDNNIKKIKHCNASL